MKGGGCTRAIQVKEPDALTRTVSSRRKLLCFFFLAGHRFLSRVTTLRVDLLVAIKIIRPEIFTSHQTGTSTREVVIETKLTTILYCT